MWVDVATQTNLRQGSHRPQAGVGAQIGRALWGLFFIGAAVFNTLVTLRAPEVYRAFSQVTFFGWYRQLLLTVALPNATAITSLVVVLELLAGVSMLWGGRSVRIALFASTAWVVFLAPAMGWYSASGLLLIVVPLWLLRFDYDRGIVSLVMGSLGR